MIGQETQSPAVPLKLNEEEQAVMDDLLGVMSRIHGWGLTANSTELVAAVHVIQGFIAQRMLHRVDPDSWNNWYGSVSAERDR